MNCSSRRETTSGRKITCTRTLTCTRKTNTIRTTTSLACYISLLLLLIGLMGIYSNANAIQFMKFRGNTSRSESPEVTSSKLIKIGLMLPDHKNARYETFDKPYFEEKMRALGNYQVIYMNADGKPLKQRLQAESLLEQGVKVIVIDAVESTVAARIVETARSMNVPVIAYDRFIPNAQLAYYVSYDNVLIGELQAKALVDKIDADKIKGGLLAVHGPSSDLNTIQFKKGASVYLDDRKYPLMGEYEVPAWRADRAYKWISKQLPKYNQDEIAGVYAANDTLAGGIVEAFKDADRPIPIITGQDADLRAVQRIVIGEQYMTIYKNFKLEAEITAEVVDKLVKGKPVVGNTEFNKIPATLLTAEVVTVENIKSTIIKNKLFDIRQICSPDYIDACEAAGLK